MTAPAPIDSNTFARVPQSETLCEACHHTFVERITHLTCRHLNELTWIGKPHDDCNSQWSQTSDILILTCPHQEGLADGADKNAYADKQAERLLRLFQNAQHICCRNARQITLDDYIHRTIQFVRNSQTPDLDEVGTLAQIGIKLQKLQMLQQILLELEQVYQLNRRLLDDEEQRFRAHLQNQQ